jgi:hypothetical protein
MITGFAGSIVAAAVDITRDNKKIPFWDPISDENSGYEGPLFPRNPWEKVTIDNLIIPGLCKVTATSKQRIEIKKTKGKDGGTTLLLGIDPASVDIEVTIWTPEQLDTLNWLMGRLWRRPSKRAVSDRLQGTESAEITDNAAFTIEHPACAMIGVFSVVIERVEPPVLQGDGTAKMKITAVQYIKPPAQQKATVRRVRGSGRVSVDPKIEQAANASGIYKPSEHEAGPTIPQAPRRGSH